MSRCEYRKCQKRLKMFSRYQVQPVLPLLCYRRTHYTGQRKNILISFPCLDSTCTQDRCDQKSDFNSYFYPPKKLGEGREKGIKILWLKKPAPLISAPFTLFISTETAIFAGSNKIRFLFYQPQSLDQRVKVLPAESPTSALLINFLTGVPLLLTSFTQKERNVNYSPSPCKTRDGWQITEESPLKQSGSLTAIRLRSIKEWHTPSMLPTTEAADIHQVLDTGRSLLRRTRSLQPPTVMCCIAETDWLVRLIQPTQVSISL